MTTHPREELKGWEKDFDRKFTTNRNGHIGASEAFEDGVPHIITKIASKDLKAFIASIEREAEEKVVLDLYKAILWAKANGESEDDDLIIRGYASSRGIDARG